MVFLADDAPCVCGLKLNYDDRYAQPSHYIGGPGTF